MGAAIRRVLGGLHSQKQAPGVDAMLLRLYEPIIFRALAAANPAVRRNALQLLVDAFPLHDPDSGAEATDALLTRQFNALGAALGDDAPAVRCAAIQGVCAILDAFWELIPSATTAAFVKRLATELAFDASQAGVRAAVVEGLASLAPNPLAQPLLAALLPQLRPLMTDGAASVRIAMADLLLVLRGVKVLQFYEVVPVQTLLNALAADSEAVAHRIQRLILPFYFSGPEEGPSRVAQLLRTNPAAGLAFCRFLTGCFQTSSDQPGRTALARSCGVPIDQVIQLVEALCEHLLNCPPGGAASAAAAANGKKGRSAKRKKAAAADVADGDADAAGSEETAEAWESMVMGVAELCRGLSVAVAAEDLEAEELAALFSASALARLLAACTSTASVRAVIGIAGALHFLPAAASVRERCLEQLLGTEELPRSSFAEVTAMLACATAHADSCASVLAAVTAALAVDEAQEDDSSCIPPERAVWFVGLMLAEEAMRGLLTGDRVLARLLPALQAAAAQDAEAAAAALQGDSGESAAAQSVVTCARAAVHALLVTEADGQPGDDGNCAQRRAAQTALTAAVQLGGELLTALQGADMRRVVAALAPPVQPAPAKKSRTAARPAGASAPQSPIRDVHGVLLGLAALLADAGKLLPAAAVQPSAAASCEFGVQLLRWAAPCAEDCGTAAAATISHVARLARNIGAAATELAPGGTADAAAASLGVTALTEQQPEGGSEGLCGAFAGLMRELVQVMCNAETLTEVTTAVRPFLAGMLSAGLKSGASPLAQRPQWLLPLAQLLGSRLPGSPPTTAAAASTAVPDEDAADGSGGGASPAADEEEGSKGSKKGGKRRGSKRRGGRGAGNKENASANAAESGAAAATVERAAETDAALAAAAAPLQPAEHAAVKALLQAASLAKVKDALCSAAVRLADVCFASESAATVLGTLQLAEVFGLKPITQARSRSSWGGQAASGNAIPLTALQQRVAAGRRSATNVADGPENGPMVAAGNNGNALLALSAALSRLLPQERTVRFELAEQSDGE